MKYVIEYKLLNNNLNVFKNIIFKKCDIPLYKAETIQKSLVLQ